MMISTNTTENNIKVLSWNCNGISGNRHHLESLLLRHNPHILALTETKLVPEMTDKEICNGYTLFRYDRTFGIGRGGRVLIGVADSTNIKVSNVSKIDDG